MPESAVLFLAVVLVIPITLSVVRRSQPTASSDDLALRELTKAGSDLTQPQEVHFLVHFPSRALALEATSRLAQYRFKHDLQTTKSGPCLATLTKRMFLRHSELQKLRRVLGETAAKSGGKLKGWTADVQEPPGP